MKTHQNADIFVSNNTSPLAPRTSPHRPPLPASSPVIRHNSQATPPQPPHPASVNN